MSDLEGVDHTLEGRLRGALRGKGSGLDLGDVEAVQALEAVLARTKSSGGKVPARRRRLTVTVAVAAAALLIISIAAFRESSSSAVHVGQDGHDGGSKAPTSAGSSGRLVGHLVLPQQSIRAGARLSAEVEVNNETGKLIPTWDCGSPLVFQIQLQNGSVQSAGGIFSYVKCETPGFVPVGESQYPVVIVAQQPFCSMPSASPPTTDQCTQTGDPPPIPSGQYVAEVLQDTTAGYPKVVLAPAPTITVTS
jgi:hypothetical protein